MLLLPWTSKVTVTLRELGNDHKIILRARPSAYSDQPDVLNVCNILSQASYIAAVEMSSWVPVNASTSKLRINGTISLNPSVTKSVQFVSFGIHPLITEGQTVLHDEINRLFSNSAFGTEDEDPDIDSVAKANKGKDARFKSDGYTNKELRGRRKAIDRWPMFYINIQQNGATKDVDVDDILDDKANSLLTITELLKAMVLGFLTKHHFLPKLTGRPTRQDPQTTVGETGQPAKQQSISAVDASHNLSRGLPRADNFGVNLIKDTLGTNLKLPSFRRVESRFDSPFEAWSRVKKGIVPSKHGLVKDPIEAANAQVSNLDRPSSTPIPSNIENRPLSIRASTPDLTQIAARRHATPLFSAAGDIIRQPFEDVPAVGAAPAHSRRISWAEEKDKLDGDDMVPWMNPVTKGTSLVNTRTGLITPRTLNDRKGNSRLSPLKKFESQDSLSSEASPWLASLLDRWDNPVFQPAEAAIQQVSRDSKDLSTNVPKLVPGHSCHGSHLDVEKAFQELPMEASGRISKDALRYAEVISQVDKKFILVKLNPSDNKERSKTDRNGAMLVIVDQHAADERIRIEALMRELCMPPQPNFPGDSGIQSTRLDRPLSYVVSPKDIDLLQRHQLHFATWGILYDLPEKETREGGEERTEESVTIRSLPPGIVERCKATPRLLIELMRSEIWKLHDQGVQPLAMAASYAQEHSWVAKVRGCPQGIIDMLNSRACRSAIMFNDDLSKEQCKTVISRLSECAFPFQCAHGRPSLIPLVDLGTLGAFGDRVDGECSWK